jgi:hypothetical protein
LLSKRAKLAALARAASCSAGLRGGAVLSSKCDMFLLSHGWGGILGNFYNGGL